VTPAIAYCLYACSARHTGTDWSRNYVSYPDGRVRRYLAVECERIQGFPDDWTLPSKPPADLDKVDSLRYKALGNAVTVPVAEWLAKRIKLYLSKPSELATNGNGNGHSSTASSSISRNLGWGRFADAFGKRESGISPAR